MNRIQIGEYTQNLFLVMRHRGIDRPDIRRKHFSAVRMANFHRLLTPKKSPRRWRGEIGDSLPNFQPNLTLRPHETQVEHCSTFLLNLQRPFLKLYMFGCYILAYLLRDFHSPALLFLTALDTTNRLKSASHLSCSHHLFLF